MLSFEDVSIDIGLHVTFVSTKIGGFFILKPPYDLN